MSEITQYYNKLLAKVEKYSRKAKSPKRLAFRLMLWNLKYIVTAKPYKKSSFSDDKTHIAVEALGGMGDLIFAAKYVQALEHYFGADVQVDVLLNDKSNSLGRLIFPRNKVSPKEKAPRYDLYLRLIRYPAIEYYDKARLSKKFCFYVDEINRFHQQHPFAERNGFYSTGLSLIEGRTRENQADFNGCLKMEEMDFTLGSPENVTEILQKFGLSDGDFITMQTGAGSCWANIKDDTRQWPAENYAELAKLIKAKYPQVKIVQLGQGWQPCIGGTDFDLRNKTDDGEVFALLKSSKLHISQEGGMVHTRHFLGGGKSVVLFGPTDVRFFGYPENENICLRKCPVCCEWLTPDWMKKCIKTGDAAECMRLLTPAEVMKFVNL